MVRLPVLVLLAASLAGCAGNRTYGTGNPISGYTDCDILYAQGSTLCDDVARARKTPPARAVVHGADPPEAPAAGRLPDDPG